VKVAEWFKTLRDLERRVYEDELAMKRRHLAEVEALGYESFAEDLRHEVAILEARRKPWEGEPEPWEQEALARIGSYEMPVRGDRAGI
jgi:hypothetical protein